MPRKTGASSPLRMSRNAAGSSESIETFTRFNPAARRPSARFASIDPFVVIETSGIWRTERSMICSMSNRISGSPPVNFTDRMPNSRDAQEPFDLIDGHLVLVGHPRLQDRTEAFIMTIDATEVASLRDAHADVRDFASEGVEEHEPS